MILHRANTRGYADHGWLKSHHTFSFADYYDPSRMHFGKLRVLNDDIIEGGSGFGLHPHNNMEIISIPITGALAHRDSYGSDDIIDVNKVQVMSAGKGISHSEHNATSDQKANFLQIWIYPRSMNIDPRYDSRYFDPAARINQFQLLVSPDGAHNSLYIHQKAYLSRIVLKEKNAVDYKPFLEDNGVYLFVISGEVEVNTELLGQRDGMGIVDQPQISISAKQDTDLIVIEVPMK
ncbi:MAG: pirin family protein [Bacteroidales bacterium]|nr:pirin family protein [Bacteroidales bacterium]